MLQGGVYTPGPTLARSKDSDPPVGVDDICQTLEVVTLNVDGGTRGNQSEDDTNYVDRELVDMVARLWIDGVASGPGGTGMTKVNAHGGSGSQEEDRQMTVREPPKGGICKLPGNIEADICLL